MKRDDLYRHLKVIGGMRVLEHGFIGQRRPLQRLLRVLRTSRDDNEVPVGGALVLGMKGVGKSCLIGRALDRHAQHEPRARPIVLHGVLDDIKVIQQFTDAAIARGDRRAETILQLEEAVPQRIWRLLTSHWADEPIIIVLDDFEQNLELRDDGDARPSAKAAAMLEVLLPACHGYRPKLLITTTASFSMPSEHPRALTELRLGSFHSSVLRKLWMRLPEVDRSKISPATWCDLAERLGRNARVLDWAMTLLRGKTPDEVADMARKAGQVPLRWKGSTSPSEEQLTELARLFLQTLAMDEARARLNDDALTFIRRARVYEWPVPKEGLQGLIDGLDIDLDRDITVLQNLGLLEVDEMDGEPAHRVSPLVEPNFDAEDPERWHSVAAAFWEQAAAREGTGERFVRVVRAWE
ncbi:MAG: ATP-binding protein, partial [Myxococcales bacterium]|nr:ATP-binding protein [Myxococcales bacterium]